MTPHPAATARRRLSPCDNPGIINFEGSVTSRPRSTCLMILAGTGLFEAAEIKSNWITSEGLLGNQYISIEPGGSMDYIKPGGEIENTQGSVDLMGLLGKAVFGATGAK